MTDTNIPLAIRNPQLVARFEARRNDFIRTLRRMKPEDVQSQTAIEGVLSELHKLAGVASLFGATSLGASATRFYAELRDAPASQRDAILRDLLHVLAEDRR